MMIVVIDLSKKLVGYNLFENFFYRFKQDGNLVFVNNPLTIDDCILKYDELKTSIQNILYDNHVSNFSLCVLYDMSDQKKDPLINSIVNNIYNIKEKIVKPLQKDYSFDKLYYFSLDDINRTYDGIPIDENISIAVDYDARGYISANYDSEYKDILFTISEIDSIDNLWNDIKNKNLSKKCLEVNNLNQAILEFNKQLKLIFDKKIDIINRKYDYLSYYAERLNKVYNIVTNNFETTLYKYADSINSIANPSVFLKETLKVEVSSYRERNSIIIRINLFDKVNYLNRDTLNYRHQLELLAIIIYLATSDTRYVFESNKSLRNENHWEITTILDENNLSRMLKSYNSKLKIELDKLNKLNNNEIIYEEFSPRVFDLSTDVLKPTFPKLNKFSLFFKNKDIKNIDDYVEKLYKRHLDGIDYSNKRLCNLTIKLRKQKVSFNNGKMKKGNVLEVMGEINKMKNQVKELQQRIAFYKYDLIDDSENVVRPYYDDISYEIKELLKKRITFKTIVKNIILIIVTSLSTYHIVKHLSLSDEIITFLSMLFLFVPLIIYLIFQLIALFSIKKKINKKISLLINNNKSIVDDFFNDNNQTSLLVKDIYDLIMLKKYIDECSLKIIAANKKFEQINYHYDRLEEHIETSNKLIEILEINDMDIEPIAIDKINEINSNKDIYSNELYCPLNYLLLLDTIKNKVIINDEQNIDIDNNLIGFVNRIIITYDKEYYHD